MKTSLQLSLVCAILSGALSCSRTDEPSELKAPEVLAQVGDAHIHRADLTYAQRYFAGLTETDTLDRLISEEVLAQSALKEGLADEPAVRAAIRRMLSSRYLEEHLNQPVALSQEAVKQRWEESSERFALPKRARLAVIRQRFDKPEAKAAVIDRLQQVQQDYRATEEPMRGFGKLAATHSDHQDTRYQGGVCGWVEEGRGHAVLPEELIQQAITQTTTGLSDEIIEADGALWLLLVEETQPSRKRPFEEVEELLRQEMEALAQSQAKADLLERATQSIPTEILHALPNTNASDLVSLTPPADPF